MSLARQMELVADLVRRPQDLPGLLAAGGEDAAVLATIDAARLSSVARCQAALVLSRWWQPRFPGVVESASTALGGPEALASALVASPAFETAQGEDLTGCAIGGGLLGLIDAGKLSAAPWLEELLAYEYLLEVGLPLRARGQAVDEALELRLLGGRARWVEGGRLRQRVVVVSFRWPVGAWHEGTVDDEDEPERRIHVLGVVGEEVVEVEAPVAAGAGLDMLVAGADDREVGLKLGRKNAARFLGWLREAELLS